MQTILNPYLSFKDNTRQAMEFYQSVFGGKLDLQTFKDFHVSEDPSEENKIMHAMLVAENGMILMAADTPNRMEYRSGSNVSISLSGDNDAEISSYFNKLSTDGMVIEPLKLAPWGDKFGMIVDRFGISWMINISVRQA